MLNNVQDLITVFDIGNPDYEVLEYIELDGTQYFDTGYYGDLDTKIEAGISFANLDTHMMVFGARNGGAAGTSNVSCLAAFGYPTANDKILVVDFNNESSYVNYRLSIKSSNLAVNTFYDIIDSKSSRSVAVDGVYPSAVTGTNPQTTNATTAFSSQYAITIGTVNGASFGGTTYYNLSGRVRYFRIIENGVLIHDYVPALDKNGKPCLYDRKNQNAIYAYKVSDDTDATDTLKYEKWINKQDVEYLEFTGTQYIDLGLTASYTSLENAPVCEFEGKVNTLPSSATTMQRFISAGVPETSGKYYQIFINWKTTGTPKIPVGFQCGTATPYMEATEADTNWHYYKYDIPNKEAFIDDTSYDMTSYTSDSITVPYNLYIGARNLAGTPDRFLIGSLKYLRWSVSGVVVRDLQPVVYQGVSCMYDKIYNRVYTNVGTGAFKHGPFTKEDTNKYEVLKYITGDGTQFFETDYFANDNSEYQYRAMCYNDVSGARQVFGVLTDNHTASVTGYLFNGTNARWADKTLTNATATANAWHDCILNKSGYTVDGVKTSFTDATITGSSERPVSIMGITPISGLPSSGGQIHLSCFKILENGILVRDYIPVLDETFTPCLYDRVNRVFLYHTNTEGSTTIPSYEAWNKKNVYYLEGTGTQYIDTGVKDIQNTVSTVKFKNVTLDGSQFTTILGAQDNSGDSDYKVLIGNASGSGANAYKYYIQTGGASGYKYSDIVANTTDLMEITSTVTSGTGNNTIIINENSYSSSYAITTTTVQSLYLFARNKAGTASSFAKILLYGLQIKQNDNLVRDFQPVVVQGTACMYDLAYNKIYTNAGTGVFIAGPDIDEPEERYEVLEKITLTGVEYFDLGYKVSDFAMGDTIRFEGIVKGTDASSITSSGSQLMFSIGNDGGQWLGKAQNGTKYAFGSSMQSTIGFNEEVLADVTITLSGNASKPTFTITGSVTSDTATSTITQRSATPTYYDFPLLFGAGTRSTGEKAYGGDYTIKCGKIYINGTMTKDYVPVLDSDGLPCLYDRVTKTFLYAKKISDGTDASATLGYQRWNKYDVDYIQSTGTQYIDTGYKPTKNLSFDLYGIDMNYSSGTTRFGSRTGTYSETFVLATIADSHFRWSYGTGSAPATTDNVFSTEKTAKQISWNATTKKCTITFTDGTTETSVQMKGADLTSSAIPVYLFAFNSVGEPICGTVKHTRIMFREGGTLIRDFKPVVWNSSSGTQACMYDEVYNKMYTNAGTGAFKAGIFGKVNGTLADIEIGASLTPVRTSAKPPNVASPYVMTDIIPNDSIGCEFIFSVSVNDKGNYILASRGDNTGRFYLYSNEGSTNIKYGWGTFEATSTATTVNHKYVMSLNKFMDKKFITDGTKLADLPPVDFSGNTFALCLFANNTAGIIAASELSGFHGDFYYGFITLFNKVIREYIPARYNSTVGVFERKTGKFLTNDSTVGSFTFNNFS